MVDPAPPVILLAFASSEDPRFQSLPRLPEEARLLRDVLEPAETEGLIKLEIRQNATLDDILRAFDRHRGRIAVFHFAGHTDDQTFLAERLLGAAASGGPQTRLLASAEIALERADWRKQESAERLGVDRATLYRMIKRFGLEPMESPTET
mgnify:CR=1 FL=1